MMANNRNKISEKLKNNLLYKSANTCCVCKDIKKGCHIHHIDEDPLNSTEEINLIVLCPSCHNEAHTKRALSQNLSPKRLSFFKREWEEEVSMRSNMAIDNKIIADKNNQKEEELSQEEKYIKEVREAFKKLDGTIHYNLDITQKAKIDEEVIQLFKKYKTEIVKVCNPKQLKNYIKKIEETSHKTRLQLKQDILEHYFTNTMNSRDDVLINREYLLEVDELLKYYPTFEEYVKKHRNNYTYKPQTLLDFFIVLIENQNGYLSKRQEIILCNSKDEIKQEIISQANFLEKVIQLIKSGTHSSDTSCLKEIIRELENENDEYKNRIEFMKEEDPLFKHKMRINL